WTVAGLQVVAVLLLELQAMASYALHSAVGERMTLGIRARLFRHAQDLSILRHDARGTTDALYRVQYDGPAVQWATTDGLLPMLTSLTTLVITMWVIAHLDLQLAVIALAAC